MLALVKSFWFIRQKSETILQDIFITNQNLARICKLSVYFRILGPFCSCKQYLKQP